MKESPSYYAVIPANVRYAEIIPNAKLLYGEITALCNKEGFCWASNNYFAKLYGVKLNTVSLWVAQLEKHGFIKSIILNRSERKMYITGFTEIREGVHGKTGTPLTEKGDHNNKYNNTVNEDTGSASAAEEKPLFSSLGADVLKEFETINPATKRMYGNKTQRQACEDLISSYGFEQVVKVVRYLPQSNNKAYLPTITTPLQLREKWAALEAGIMKQVGKVKEKSASRITPNI